MEDLDMGEFDMFEYVRLGARNVGTTFSSPDDDWAPIAFLKNSSGMGVMPLGELMGDENTKELLATEILPKVIKTTQAHTIVLALSAWTVKLEENEDVYGIPPSQHPRRDEQLFICEYTPYGVGRLAVATINRDGKNPPTLGEWEDQEHDKMTGMFVDPIVSALAQVGGNEQISI